MRDPVHDKMVNSKQAKELFEQATRLEAEFHHLFTATIPVTIQNVGAKLICQQIQDTVEHQQKKTLWLLSKDPL